MEINLTPEQNDAVLHAMKTGRIHNPEEAGQQAMALWIENERKRAALIRTLDAAEASHARGESVTIGNEAEATAFFADIKQRGRARLEAEKSVRPW